MFLIPWLLAIGFAAGDEIVVSKLLRRQYLNYRADWEADGRPRGIFWVPKEAKVGAWYVTYASGHAGQLARWRWFFKRPDWLSSSADAGSLLLMHRIFLSGFVVCLIAPFVIAAFMQ